MLYEPTTGYAAKSANDGSGAEADPVLSARLAQIAEQGFCVIEGAFSAAQVSRTREQLAPWLQRKFMGRNNFEGEFSERVYALLAKAPVIAEMVAHPDVLAIADRLLAPNYLLSAALAINVHPGETPQPWHIDDGAGDASTPRPRPPMGVSAIWAIDDFTANNGATEVAPGSHRWEAGREPAEDEIHRVEMASGSVLVFAGNLVHRGGANTSDGKRLAITPQYCQPWLRQIENMVLAVPPDQAGQYAARVRALLGYNIVEPGFMGYVDGRHPGKLIDQPASSSSSSATP